MRLCFSARINNYYFFPKKNFVAISNVILIDLNIVQYIALKEILIHIQSYYRTGHCNKLSSIFCQETWKYSLKNKKNKTKQLSISKHLCK